MDLAKYQKVEIVVLGLISPILLLTYTILLLLSGEAVFWGRSATIIYHSNDAYFVSLLWFGVAGSMFSHFLLRPLKVLPQTTRKLILYISMLLLCSGLLSAIVLV
jgi:hypothetical protein